MVGKAIVAAVAAKKPKLFVGPIAQLSALMRRFMPTLMKRQLTLATAAQIGFWK